MIDAVRVRMAGLTASHALSSSGMGVAYNWFILCMATLWAPYPLVGVPLEHGVFGALSSCVTAANLCHSCIPVSFGTTIASMFLVKGPLRVSCHMSQHDVSAMPVGVSVLLRMMFARTCGAGGMDEVLM